MPVAALLVLIAVLALPSAAAAALPEAGARYEAHDHASRTDAWHVEAEVARRSPRRIATLVVHAQRCRATVFRQGLTVGDDGALDAAGAVRGRGGQGLWRLEAAFGADGGLHGTFTVATPTCTATQRFDAHRPGAGGHQHGGGLPDPAHATPAQRRQATRLWRATLRAARTRFRTYAMARRAGFVRFARRWERPLVFHLRSKAYDADDRWLDPDRPESLVFWWPARGKPVLIAFMYRWPDGPRPRFGGPIPSWHTHLEDGRRGDTQMTHVWLTRGLRSAWAGCLPVAQLERALPRFDFVRTDRPVGHESTPCP